MIDLAVNKGLLKICTQSFVDVVARLCNNFSP
jgi:hypothetical protein